MSCNKATEIHRYHDRELPLAEQKGVEAHLEACPECRELLADLRRLSAMIGGATRPQLPAEVLEGLRQSWQPRDRGILQLASWLTATAAVILIGAMLARPTAVGLADSGRSPGQWEEAWAVLPPSEAREEAGSDPTVMAEWMADDLSSDQKEIR